MDQLTHNQPPHEEVDAVVLTSVRRRSQEPIPTTEILWGVRGLSMLLSKVTSEGDHLDESECLAFASALECMTSLMTSRMGTVPTAAEEQLQAALESHLFDPPAPPPSLPPERHLETFVRGLRPDQAATMARVLRQQFPDAVAESGLQPTR